MPFRARSLLCRPAQRNLKSDSLRQATTRRDTVTGTPGSVVERRLSPRSKAETALRSKQTGNILNEWASPTNSISSFSYRKVAEWFYLRKTRTGGYNRPESALVPHLVDLPMRDLRIPEKGIQKVGPVRPLRRYVRNVYNKTLYESDKEQALTCFVLKNVNNTLTFETVAISNWKEAFNKNCKAFGPISRNRHFRFYLKYITFFGMSKKDFRNVLRIRELWIRSSKHFKKAMLSFNFACNNEHKMFINKVLPLKAGRGRTT